MIVNPKIDRRKSYYITIDTETLGTIEKPLAYDVGLLVHDKHGNPYEYYSFVVYETFVLMPEEQEQSYFGYKRPIYLEDIENGSRKVWKWSRISWLLHELCKKYKPKAILAYNANFDYRSCNNNQRLFNKKYKYFFPYGVPVWDTLKMARDVIATKKTYIMFCEKHGFLTDNGKPQVKAETVFRYMKNNPDFEESHTGLEDCMIEAEIFAYCVRQHKKMRRELKAPKKK